MIEVFINERYVLTFIKVVKVARFIENLCKVFFKI